jgi:hypothetical protein
VPRVGQLDAQVLELGDVRPEHGRATRVDRLAHRGPSLSGVVGLPYLEAGAEVLGDVLLHLASAPDEVHRRTEPGDLEVEEPETAAETEASPLAQRALAVVEPVELEQVSQAARAAVAREAVRVCADVVKHAGQRGGR